MGDLAVGDLAVVDLAVVDLAVVDLAVVDLASRGRESAGAGPRVRMQQSPGLFGPFG